MRFFLVLLTITTVVSCRSNKRESQIGGEITDVRAILHPLDESDIGQSNLIYELRVCTPGPVLGQVMSENKVLFKGRNLDVGDVCDIRVTMPEPQITKELRWHKTRGVMYWDREVRLERDDRGDLIGVTNMQKRYDREAPIEEKVFKLKVPVTFPRSLRTGLLETATLSCEPTIANHGVLKKDSDKDGSFVFDLAAQDKEQTYTCQGINVWVQGKYEFAGEFEEGVRKIVAKAGEESTLKQTVALRSKESFQVDLKNSVCGFFEVYDVKKKACIPRS